MGLCIFFDIIYIVCKEKNKNIIGLFAKVLAAFCFITIGYMAYTSNKTQFIYLILFGLVLDGIGDLFLALRNIFAKNLTFLIGSISFLCGHIMFLRAELLIENNYLINCIIFAVITGAILFYLFNKVCHFNKIYTIVGIIYLIIIAMMVYMSLGIYLTHDSVKNLVFLIGAIFFMSSDIILVIYNFSKKEKWMHPVYSLLYFIGQLLISYSLHL